MYHTIHQKCPMPIQIEYLNRLIKVGLWNGNSEIFLLSYRKSHSIEIVGHRTVVLSFLFQHLFSHQIRYVFSTLCYAPTLVWVVTRKEQVKLQVPHMWKSRFGITFFTMIENPSYDRVLADQEDKTKLPKFQLYQVNRGDFIGRYIYMYHSIVY